MADGSRAFARSSRLPTEPREEPPRAVCSRCEDMELIDCDLCGEGQQDCPRCEGLGLMVCPACDAPSSAPLPVAPTPLQPRPCVRAAAQVSPEPDAIASSARTYEKRNCVAWPGPQPKRKGADSCGARLRWARLRLGLTLVQLAKAAGYSSGSLASYESDLSLKGPPLKTIEDLAQALGVRRSWLAFGLGSVEPQRAQSPKSELTAASKSTEAAR